VLAVAEQVDVAPKFTGLGAQFAVPPPGGVVTTVIGKLFRAKVAVTMQFAVTAPVV
jgi:hypothetical protein